MFLFIFRTVPTVTAAVEGGWIQVAEFILGKYYRWRKRRPSFLTKSRADLKSPLTTLLAAIESASRRSEKIESRSWWKAPTNSNLWPKRPWRLS